MAMAPGPNRSLLAFNDTHAAENHTLNSESPLSLEIEQSAPPTESPPVGHDASNRGEL